MTLPNFFIVGAPKAGTDELYYDLVQHPEIYLSPLKEPCYFSLEVRPERFQASLRERAERTVRDTRKYLDEGMPEKRFGGIVSDPDDYGRLFSGAKDQRAIGEGSVCYLWSTSAAASIAAAVPHARIIIVLMDPAERAYLQYLKSLSDGTVRHRFSSHLQAALHCGSELSIYHPFLAFGNYFDQVQRYMSLFPPRQLHISIYEDIVADKRAWFRGILSFLAVDNEFLPEPVEVPSKPHVPLFIGVNHKLRNHLAGRSIQRLVPKGLRSLAKRVIERKVLPKLRAEDRAILVDYYRKDVLKLEALIERDLTAWLC